MSTRASIKYYYSRPFELHIYHECLDNEIYLELRIFTLVINKKINFYQNVKFK